MSSSVVWYAARAGGLVAFALLTVTVVLGATLAGRGRTSRWPRFAVEDVHRFAGVLTGAFIVVHGAGLLADRVVPFSLSDLMLPGTAPYRPAAVAAGVVAAELLAAVGVANALRPRISYSLWRRVHYATLGVWALALVHGVTAGTDGDASWAIALYGAATAAVAGAVVWRILRSARAAPWTLRLWPGTAAVAGAEFVVALALVTHRS